MLTRTDVYAGGAWTPSTATAALDVLDPATEAVIARVPDGTPADVDRAVAAAVRALPGWSATSREDRAKHLARLRDGVAARSAELARTVTAEMGAPAKLAERLHVGLPLAVLESLPEVAEEVAWEERVGNSLVVREPVGVVGAITPWNYPLHQVVAKVGPALAAGCTVVLKPSEVAPLSAYLFAEIVHEAGLPPGVVNVVPGTGRVAGEALAAHPDVDMVSFTGSTRAGRRVAELAAATVKRVALELGGKSANVILDDADLAAAVPAGVASCFLNAGQTCSAWSRMLVPRALEEEVAERARAAAETYRPGDPTAPGTRLGPLASAAQRERVLGYVRGAVAEGARLVTGGADRPDGLDRGYYVRPTVFAGVTPDMTVAREEVFGPVLAIVPYDGEADALRLANATDYGLAGGVWSADGERALAFARRMRAGQVDVNGGRFNPRAPFGGRGRSGHGRELGRYGVEEFLELKSIQL